MNFTQPNSIQSESGEDMETTDIFLAELGLVAKRLPPFGYYLYDPNIDRQEADVFGTMLACLDSAHSGARPVVCKDKD